MSHLDTIHSMGCILCELLGMKQTSKTDAHHPRTGQGGAQRAPDALAIPLCHDGCHQGPHGVHGDRSLLRQAKVTELGLVAIVVGRLLAFGGNAPPAASRKMSARSKPREKVAETASASGKLVGREPPPWRQR